MPKVVIEFSGPISVVDWGTWFEVYDFATVDELEAYIYSCMDGLTTISIFNAYTGDRIYLSDL